MKRLLVSLREIAGRLWIVLLLLYIGSVLFFSLPGKSTLPVPLILPFYIFIPGYAFVVIFLPKLCKLEKVAACFGFSLAFVIGIKALRHTFELTGLSDFVFLAIFSAACLIMKLILKE